MGKLADLWQQYNDTPVSDPYRKELQKQINDIETWMIGKGLRKEITKWNEGEGSDIYPWHTGSVRFEDIFMVAGLNGIGINYNRDKSVHVCQQCNL